MTLLLDPYQIYPLLRPVFLFNGNYNGLALLINQSYRAADVRSPRGVVGRCGRTDWSRGVLGVVYPNPSALRCHDPIYIGKVQVAVKNYETFRSRFEQKDLVDIT